MKKLFLLSLMAMALPVMALDTLYTANVTFTNNPANNDTVTISGVVKTFKSTVTDPSTQVQIGATTTDTYNAYVAHLVLNGYANLTVIQPPAGTVVTLVAPLNTAITGSVSGTWGTVTIYSTSITSQSLFLPLSVALSSAYQVAMANALIIGIRDYASTNFAANTSALQHFLNDSTTQTMAGSKTFSGANVYSNASQVFSGGSITQATIKTIFLGYDNAHPNGVEFFSSIPARVTTLASDANGYPTLYGTAISEIPSTTLGGIAPPSGGSLLWRAAADFRYGQLGAANAWTAANTFSGALTLTSAGSFTFTPGAAMSGALTNLDYGGNNAYLTNLYLFGPMISTSAAPALLWYNTAGSTYGTQARIALNGTGIMNYDLYDLDGTTSHRWLQVYAAASSADYHAIFPIGTLEGNQIQSDGKFVAVGTGNFGGIVGIGDTNITVPTSLTRGIVLTNGASASADPANGVAIWSAGGEAFMRTSTASEGAGINARIFNRGEQSIGSGSDYTLTGSYAEAAFGSGVVLSLPSAGTYEVSGIVTVDEDGANANDSISVKLYNTTDAADLTGSEKTISYLPAAKRGQVSLKSIITITAAKTIKLYAKNGTAARGSVDSDQTSLYYVRLY